jgi:hypothetical protein
LSQKKSRQELYQQTFLLGIFWDGGGVSGYAATPLIAALSPGHSDITRFCPWSLLVTGVIWIMPNEKIPKVAQMTGTIDVFDLHSGISGATSWRASTCPNLHE